MESFKSVNEILNFAIQSEQEAVEFYSQLSNDAKNEEMKHVFTQFAKEEMGHKAKLLQIKETGNLRISEEKVNDLMISDYLVDVDPTPGMSYREALVVAMKKEKNAFKLYMKLSEQAEDAELKEIFLSLAQEESKHKLRFELEYDEYVLREN